VLHADGSGTALFPFANPTKPYAPVNVGSPPPGSVRPQMVPGQGSQTVTFPGPGGALSGAYEAPIAQALVWMSAHQLWVKNGKVPVSFAASEVATLTGLTVEEVVAAYNALVASGQLQVEPNRSGSGLPKVTPVI
jgi:hypothetical protein